MPPLDPSQFRHLVNCLAAGELGAELQLLRLGCMERPVQRDAWDAFDIAYGWILDKYLDLTTARFGQRGITVPEDVRKEWRDHIVWDFFRNATELGDRCVAEEAGLSRVGQLKSRFACGRRRMIEAYWRHNLQKVGADGMRQSLGHIVEGHVSVWCTMRMASSGPQP